MRLLILSLLLLMQVVTMSCQTNDTTNVIAIQGKYELTIAHLDQYITKLQQEDQVLSYSEIQREKDVLIQQFLQAPEAVLQSLVKEESEATNTLNTTQNSNPTRIIAMGNQKVRSILGTDIGQMQFDSPAANTFRNYIANSLFTSSSNSPGTGYNSSNYSESTAAIQFCPDGTFVQALSGYMNISVEGMSATTDNSPNYMPGYWEVAALPNNMLVILFYSTHPSMLEDSPNGFLPFIVASYTSNFVSLPNGDGYSRTAHQYCN